MARNLEDELAAFMKARIEQDPVYQTLARGGFAALDADTLTRIVWHVVGVHREVLLRIARELDNMAVGEEPDEEP